MHDLPILIIEVNVPLGQYLADVTSQLGYQATVANSVADGLKAVARQAYSLILADYIGPQEQLPYRWPVLHLLAHFAPQTPIIAMTALEEVLQQDNVVGVLRIPFNDKSLAAAYKRHALARPQPASKPILARYLAALWDSNADEANRVVADAEAQGWDEKQIYEQLFTAALYEIGDLWGENLCTEAEEHAASALTERLMAVLAARAARKPPKDRSILIACLVGEHHEIGARQAADCFSWDGWTVRFLGADTPEADVVTEARRKRFDIVGLSATLKPSWAIVKSQIAALHQVGVTGVILGGQGFHNLDKKGLAALGADGQVKTAREGVDLANRLLARGGEQLKRAS